MLCLEGDGNPDLQEGLMGDEKQPPDVPALLSLFLLRAETEGKEGKNPRDSQVWRKPLLPREMGFDHVGVDVSRVCTLRLRWLQALRNRLFLSPEE